MLFVVQFLDQQIKTSSEKTWQKHAWKADVHMLTLPCFIVKNPSLKTYCSQLWTFPALPSHSPSRAVPMDHSFFHNTQATRHMSIHLGEFLHIYRICVVMEVTYLSDLVPTQRFAFVLRHTRTCSMIHYLLIPPAAAQAETSANLPKISCFQEDSTIANKNHLCCPRSCYQSTFLFPDSHIL